MSSSSIINPPVAWAQRKDILYLTVQMEDLNDKELKCTESKVTFKANGGQPRRAYAFELEFFKNVDPNTLHEKPSGKQLIITVKKAEIGPFWPRLTKDSKKLNWLKTDFDKWRDEDDSDVDTPLELENNDFESQMASLGGNADGADDEAPEDNEDSDDDALPDLE